MARGDVVWASLPPFDRRPVLIVTRSGARHSKVTVAPVTRTVRGIASEVPLGVREGLRWRCVANVDDLLTVPRAILDAEPAGRLGPDGHRQLDQALVYALEIRTAAG